ncbi:MAG: restriction endonuclease subunit R [Cyanobacteria bacterium J06631_9]
MAQAIAIEKVTWQMLKRQFGLQRAQDETFFAEWKTDLPKMDAYEKKGVERIKAAYHNMEELDLVLESSVNVAILGPLLETAGLFLPPFHLETEKPVEFSITDEQDARLKGRLDALIIKDFLWILTIESKQAGFSLRVGIAQLLAYMMAAPKAQKSVYGMITNGRSFMFIKLERSPRLVYERSKEFIIGQDSGLEQTLRILKKLSTLAFG